MTKGLVRWGRSFIQMRSPLRLLLGVLAATIALGSAAGPALAAPPANDDFATAEALPGNRGAAIFDLTDATAQAGEPTNAATDERTLWFTYTPTSSGFATFAFCDTELYPIAGANLSVFTGATLAGLSVDSESSGGCPGGQANASIVAMGVSAGTTYSVQLGSTAATENVGGTLVYDFNEALPLNDDFGDAQTISGSLPQTIDADTGLATTELDETGIESYGPFNSIWFRWTPATSGPVSIDTCSTVSENPAHPADSKLEIFTNTNDPADLAGAVLHAAADDGCSSPTTALSRAYLNVNAGTEYRIRLVNYSDKFGAPYELNLREITTPEISGPPIITPQTTHVGIGETLTASVPDWFANPAITSVELQWQLCDSTGVTCNDIVGETGPTYAPIITDLGQRLKLIVTGTNGVETTVEESVTSAIVELPPANDNYADIIDLGSTAPASVTSDNYYATLETDENTGASDPIEGSVWYRWTAPAERTYFVDGCQSSSAYSFAVNVYTGVGSPLAELAEVGSINGGCENSGPYSRTYFTATPGQQFLIQAGNVPGESFVDFTMTISEVPVPSFTTAPTLDGPALEDAVLTLGFEDVNTVIPTQTEIDWTLCDSAGDNCGALADDGLNELQLAPITVGSRVKATVTLTNANGTASASVTSAVIQPDSDNDGVTDADDSCPTEAGTRPNGCEPSDVVANGAPTLSGGTVVGQQLTATTGLWTVLHDPLGLSYSYQWQRCTSTSGGSCSTLAASASNTYTLGTVDVLKVIRVLVTATNDDDSATQASAFSAPITAVAVTPPQPGDGSTPPPPAADPFPQPTAPKSLGKVKLSKKNTITLSKLSLLCGESATGPCTGSITFKTAKVKKGGKTIKSAKQTIKVSVLPRRTMLTTFKLNSAMVKAIKLAKSLKTSIVIKLGAPGFSAKSLSTGATVSLK